MRRNEAGIPTKFSIDLHGLHPIPPESGLDAWGALFVLAECKYNYSGVKWVFAPNPSVFAGKNSVTELSHLTTKKIDLLSIGFHRDLPCCFRGVELHDTEANPNAISRALHQMWYAAPKFVRQLLEMQLMEAPDDVGIDMICPLIVTTASLHVLHENLSLAEFEKADDLAKISRQVEALIVSHTLGPHISDYIDEEISGFYDDNPVSTTLAELSERRMQAGWDTYPESLDWSVKRTFREAAESVLVINYSSLERILERLVKVATDAGKTLRVLPPAAELEDEDETE